MFVLVHIIKDIGLWRHGDSPEAIGLSLEVQIMSSTGCSSIGICEELYLARAALELNVWRILSSVIRSRTEMYDKFYVTWAALEPKCVVKCI